VYHEPNLLLRILQDELHAWMMAIPELANGIQTRNPTQIGHGVDEQAHWEGPARLTLNARGPSSVLGLADEHAFSIIHWPRQDEIAARERFKDVDLNGLRDRAICDGNLCGLACKRRRVPDARAAVDRAD